MKNKKYKKNITSRKSDRPHPSSPPDLNHTASMYGDSRFFSSILKTFESPFTAYLTLIAITILVYLPALNVPWYFDDYNAILNNQKLQTFQGLQNIFQNYIHRSIVQFTYAMDWQIGILLGFVETSAQGESTRPLPLIFHITSIIIHILVVSSTFPLYRLLFSLFTNSKGNSSEYTPSERVFFPFLTSLWFAILPVHTEAVAYLSGRSSALAALEYTVGVYSMLRSAIAFGLIPVHYSERSQCTAKGIAWFLVFIACFILGIGTKETVFTLPATAGAIFSLTVIYRISLFSALKHIISVFLLVVLFLGFYIGYRIFTLGTLFGFDDVLIRSWWVNGLSQTVIVTQYYLPRQSGFSELCLCPLLPEIDTLFHPKFLIGISILSAMLGVAIVTFHTMPLVAVGLAWYFISISTTSSVVPLLDLAAERHVYLPDVGFCLAIAALISGVIHRSTFTSLSGLKRVLPILSIVYFAFLLISCFQRNFSYTDPVGFWEQELAKDVANEERILFNLSQAYEDDRQYQKLADSITTLLGMSEAEKPPTRFGLMNKLAVVYMVHLKQYDRAIEILKSCLLMDPASKDTYLLNIGNCYLLSEDFDRAEQFSKAWLSDEPNNLNAMNVLGTTLQAKGLLDDAESVFLKILESAPNDVGALQNLVLIYQKKGNERGMVNYQAILNRARNERKHYPRELYGGDNYIRKNSP